MTLFRTFVYSAAFIGAGTQSMARSTASRAIPADIESRTREWLTKAEPFGVTGAIAMLRDTTVTLAAGFGPLAPQGGTIGPDTPFILASLSKQFTAAAIVRAVADGKLSLSDSIGRFFPDAPTPQRGITVQQLLTHTSGMVYLDPHMFDPAPDRAAFMRELISLPLDFAPGARWSYSNPGYAVLAGILERAEGRSFETVLTDRVFTPAGMHATTFVGRPVTGAPHGYQLGEDQGPMSDVPGADRAVGNGSIVSTARDLAKWEVALRTNRVLDAHWTTEVFTPRVSAGPGGRYAFGWNVLPTPRGTTLFYHAGDLGPFNTEFRRYADDNFTLIWLSNARLASGGTRTIVTRVVANMLNGAPVVMPPAVGARDTAYERAVGGRYVLASGDTLVVTRDERSLMIGARGASALLAMTGGATDSAASASAIAGALDALQKNDATLLRERLHPSLPSDDAIDGTRRLLAVLRDSLGAPLRFVPLGIVPSAPGSATVWVRITGSRRSLAAGFGLSGGRIIAFANPTELAAPTRLLHSADGKTQYVDFDAAASRTTRVTFTDGALSLTAGDTAPVTAKRG